MTVEDIMDGSQLVLSVVRSTITVSGDVIEELFSSQIRKEA